MTAKHPEGLKKKELKRFRDLLLEKKEEILKNAKRTLNEDMTLDQDDLPDEMDLASSEYLQSFTPQQLRALPYASSECTIGAPKMARNTASPCEAICVVTLLSRGPGTSIQRGERHRRRRGCRAGEGGHPNTGGRP